MRISDDRYHRDRLRLDIAVRFIEHEARTHTIRQWTGLTDDRIRKLYRSYLHESPGRSVHRHRGKSPHQPAHFMRTARMRQEAAVLASVCLLVGLLSGARSRNGTRLQPDVRRGQLLCQAFEVYRALVETPMISFEHAVFLVNTLSRNEELATDHCSGCDALVVVDRLSLRAPRCLACAPVVPNSGAVSR
jgi:hypothetical protein